MRISTQYQYSSYLSQINSAQQRYFEAQQEVITGRRNNLFSSDPSGGAFVLRASSLKSGIKQYEANLRNAKDYLNTTESSLTEANELLKSAYATALKGANSTTDQTAREAMAAEITQIQSRLLNLANSRGSSGQYVFAGQDNASAPFAVAGGTLTFSGDANNVTVETSAGQTMAVNSHGQAIFTNAYNALEQLKLHLVGGDIAALSGVDVQAIQNSLDAVKQERGNVGAKLKTVQDLSAQNLRRMDELTSSISDVQDVDMSEAIMNYQLAETAYQAALQVTSKGYGLSLMDFIR